MPDNHGASPDAQSTLDARIQTANVTITEYMTRRGLQGGAGLDLERHGTATPSSSDLQGNRYDIGELVARGGMGAILAAKDLNILRRVAMKVMLPGQETAPDQVVRFIEEAQVTGQLEHPNIVPVHELSVDAQDRVFYTMKLVHGATLKEILQQLAARDSATLARYPLSALLTIFLKACDAIAFAHAKGVIHRDLKPENLMVGEFGEVLVMDWGLAKVLRQPAEGTPAGTGQPAVAAGPAIESARAEAGDGVLRTLDGQVLGTPAFMAPEQAEGRIGDLDARTDIYALGAILYNLLVLRPPVEGGTLAELLDKVSAGQITPPAVVRVQLPGGGRQGGKASPAESRSSGPDTSFPHCPGGQVPAALSAVAMKALGRKPEQRYASVQELQAEIERYQSGFATLAENASLGRQLALLLQRHRGFVTAAALVSLAVLGGLVVSLTQWRRAVAARDQAEYASYRAMVGLAQGRLTQGDEKGARANLAACPERFRHWEWGFLSRECRGVEESTDRNASAYPDVAMATDGRRVAWPARDGGIVVAPVGGGERRVLGPQANCWRSISFAPDGESFAVLSRAGNNATTGVLELYRVGTGECLWRMEVPAGPGCQVAVSPATPYAVAGGSFWGPSSPPFSLVDLGTGAIVGSIGQTDDRALAAVWALDGKGVWWSCDHALHLYDVSAAKETQRFAVPPRGPWKLALSPDGQRIASARDAMVRLWDAESGNQVGVFWHSATVNALLFGAGGRYLLGGGQDGSLCVWDTATGGLAGMTRGRAIHSLAGSPGSDVIYVGTSTEGVRRTSLGEITGRTVADRLAALLQGTSTGSVRFSGQGSRLLYAPAGRCALLSPDGMSASHIVNGPVSDITCLSTDWDGDESGFVASGYTNGDVHVWDLRARRRAHEFRGNRQGYAWATVCWIEPGRLLAAGGQVGAEVNLYDVRTGALVRRLETGTGLVLALALSPDQRTLYVGGRAGLTTYDIATWQPAAPALSPITDLTTAIAFSPDGRWLAVAGEAKGAQGTRLWRTGQSSMHAYIPGAGTWRLTFTADGKRLAADVNEGDGAIAIIDPERGALLLTLTDHGSGMINGLAFSPDSRRLASTAGNPDRPLLSREADPWPRHSAAKPGRVPRPAASTTEAAGERGAGPAAPADAGQTTRRLTPVAQARAWVWADQPTAASYIPNQGYQYNSSGLANRISRSGVGQYRVDLPGLGVAGGIVQVSSYHGKHHSKVVNWGPVGNDLQVTVHCVDPAGAPVDALFALLFYVGDRSGATTGAYLRADQPSTTSYTPSPLCRWSSGGGRDTVRRLGQGRYEVCLSALAEPGGMALVTAYGPGPERAKVEGWEQSGSDALVRVNCFTASGAPVDTLFALSFMSDVGLGRQVPPEPAAGGWVWADQPETASYTPPASHQFCSAGTGITVSRLTVGSYRVRFPGLAPLDRTLAMASACGPGNGYVGVNSWTSDGGDGTDVFVNGFDAQGSPADTGFTVLYLTDDPTASSTRTQSK